MTWREAEDCDCFNEEVDAVEGVAWCLDCGTRRHLSSEQITERLEAEARWQAEYDRQCHEWEQEQQAEQRFLHENPGAASQLFMSDDEIPFMWEGRA